MAPQVGLEPTTLRLTAGCSAIELLRSGYALATALRCFFYCNGHSPLRQRSRLDSWTSDPAIALRPFFSNDAPGNHATKSWSIFVCQVFAICISVAGANSARCRKCTAPRQAFTDVPRVAISLDPEQAGVSRAWNLGSDRRPDSRGHANCVSCRKRWRDSAIKRVGKLDQPLQ